MHSGIVLSSSGGVSLAQVRFGTTPHIEPPSRRIVPSRSAVMRHSPTWIRRGRQNAATGLALRQDRARDDHALHLARALADRAQLGVAPHALDGVLARVAVAAVDLDRIVGDAH